MKIFGMGGLEIVIILVVVLLIFGPKNLPKLGSAIGKTVSNLRAGMNEGKKDKKKDGNDEAEPTADDGENGKAPAALEGEVAEVSEVVEQNVQADGSELGSNETLDAPADGEPVKKVRRVVKKKVASEEGVAVE